MQKYFCKHGEEDAILILTIADDGKGFNITKAANGNGLSNMQKRANELKGKILIESKINEGTTIKLSVPLNEREIDPRKWGIKKIMFI